MKIQIFSDIHMEGYQNPSHIWKFIMPQAPVAVIAGDIDTRKFEETITEIASKFEKVFCVLGNHEFYHRDIAWRPTHEKMPTNVTLLDRTCEEYKGILFIGTTLWTDFKNDDWFVRHAADRGINDFCRILNGEFRFTAEMALQKHKQEKEWLKIVLEQNTAKKVVVVTHFLPSYQLVHERWKNSSNDTLNYYFSAGCDELINPKYVDAWIFGHTHDRRDTTINNVPMYCNPLGYAGKNRFQEMIVEI